MRIPPSFRALAPMFVLVSAALAGEVAPAAATTQAAGPDIKAALQERREWTFADPAPAVTIDNQFSGARVNGCTQVGAHDYRILITPENEPINPSPWYAFRVRAAAPTDVTIRIAIATAKSRPRARLSDDGIHWKRAGDDQWTGAEGAKECVLKLKVGPKPTWVASNHMIGNEQLWAWTDQMAQRAGAKASVIGQSMAGRPLKMVEFA